ncbi:MAG: alpha/beta hydrolase [Actinomycetes bacterium]
MNTVPVVLLHAFPLNREMFTAQHQALADAGYQVLTPDLPGYGSNQGQHLPSDESLDVFADAVAALLDSHGIDRAVIGGLTLGGYVTLAFLRRYPDRVAGLVLMDTRASADDDAGRAGRLAFANQVDKQGVEWIPGAMMAGLLSDPTPQQQQTVRSWILAADPAVVAWTQRAMAMRPDSIDLLRGFEGPALVLVGEQDTLTPPAMSVAMADACAEAQLVRIPECGHLSTTQKPDEVSHSILQWLGQHATTLAMR